MKLEMELAIIKVMSFERPQASGEEIKEEPTTERAFEASLSVEAQEALREMDDAQKYWEDRNHAYADLYGKMIQAPDSERDAYLPQLQELKRIADDTYNNRVLPAMERFGKIHQRS